MRKEVVETGKNVEAAIEAACEKLGCGRDECEWEILELPKKKGFLGLKIMPAKVKVWIDSPEEAPARKEPPKEKPAPVPSPAANKAPAPPKPAFTKTVQPKPEPQPERKVAVAAASVQMSESQKQKVERTKEYIQSILKAMELNAQLHVTYEENSALISIDGQGLGMIIGRRGETLDAIQYLSSLVANRLEGDYLRITVDCGNYRDKRRETLEALAKKLAGQVLKTNINKTLEPMNPFERRIIHATVSEIEGVSSFSVGEEPNRRVIITSPNARSRGPRRNTDGRPFRGDRGGDRDRRPRSGGPRRDDRDRRSSSPRPAAPVEQGPPKQTPEATTDKPLYAKIDLE